MYDFSNERLNALLEDETVFIVNGPRGRRPMIADTEDEAITDYLNRFYEEDEENEIGMDCV